MLECPARSIMLCRWVRSSTFFSVKGKYSCKWVVMSSEGGRCPRKLRSLLWVFERKEGVGDAGLEATSGGGASARSGSGTPRLLRMDTELARFICLTVRVSGELSVLLTGLGLVGRGGASPKYFSRTLERLGLPIRRRVRPCSRAGLSGSA